MLDKETNLKLRQRFNPEGSLLRTRQMRMLEMLKFIHAVCEKHAIPYWLSSGTCLGAVRHGGFIPWDDDVDIEMLEKDYNRFVRIINSDPDNLYVVQNHKSDNGYYHPFGKLKRKDGTEKEIIPKPYDRHYRYFGLFIDIFPMVKSSSLKLHHLGFFFHRINALGWRIKSEAMRRVYDNTVGAVARRVCLPVLQRLGAINAKGQLRHRGGCVYDLSRSREDIFPLTQIEFEGVMLNVPGNFEAYLTKIYGDYNALPPLDKINANGGHFK